MKYVSVPILLVFARNLISIYSFQCGSCNSCSTIKKNLLPFYYQIENKNNIKNKPIKIVIDGNNLCIFKDMKTQQIKLIEDRCPHRSASLSKGELSSEGGINCCYHGLNFYKGSKTKFADNIKIIDNDIFFSAVETPIAEPYFPKEYYDKSYRFISGSYKIKSNHMMILNNIIDSLHISQIHSFATKNQFPEDLSFERLSDISYRQYFNYKTGKESISNYIQKMNNEESVLKVENEYSLPNNVLSRVFINKKDIKTVCVNVYPINENESIIYWKLYRNFLIFDFEPLNKFIDNVLKYLFEFTLQEDIAIMNKIYFGYQDDEFDTKYDKIQVEFRKDIEKYRENDKI
jgi:hypothetical protein